MSKQRVCVQNPTIKSVAPRYRKFVEEALDKLSTHFASYQDTWELRVHYKEFADKNGFGRYVLMFWHDPYSIKVSIYPDNRISFELEDSNFGVYLLKRHVYMDKIIEMNIGEVDFFINSIDNIFELKEKMHTFTESYLNDELPTGYKRNEKIKQLLA